MKNYLNIIIAYSIMLGLIILVGIFQSWSIALTIFNYCMISAVMTMGANIQWGYAGLINFGIMGYTALGGLAVVLVSVAPVSEAWSVGGINMITALLVTVLDKTKLIASLKVLGSNNNSIKKIFMINGFYLILRGVILGNLISLSLMLLQKYFMIIKLDPNTYYSDYVPIEIDPFNLFLTNLIVVVISLAMLIIPSNVISKIKPNSTFKLS